VSHESPPPRSPAPRARHVPAELAAALEPVLTLVSTLTQQIRTIERTLDGVAARYPETQRLRQVGSVGPH